MDPVKAPKLYLLSQPFCRKIWVLLYMSKISQKHDALLGVTQLFIWGIKRNLNLFILSLSHSSDMCLSKNMLLGGVASSLLEI